MPNRGQQLGKRRPFVRRPGIGKFPSWDGMNREGDPAACPANAFRMLINTRTDDSEIYSRGGQAALNPDDVIDGCIGGIFPPEFEPPDQSFKRLFIDRSASSGNETFLFCPDENEEVTSLSNGFGAGTVGAYWSGQRLLVQRYLSGDGGDGFLDEFRVDTSSGTTQLGQLVPPAGIELTWPGSVGGTVLAGGEHYQSRYASDEDPAEGIRLELLQFGATEFEFVNEAFDANAGVSAPVPALFVTAAPDGRVIWLNKSTSVAELSIRSTADGTYSQVTFPTGFTPIDDSLHAWAWHAGKLYIGGVLSGAIAIAAYDPVANSISTARTISGTATTHCPMAAHKGVLYFAYGLSGGAERVGMLRKGSWTDSIAAFAAPADIYDLCSFQDHLYMTKDVFLLRCSDPSSDPTFETFYDNTGGDPLGAMVAVP